MKIDLSFIALQELLESTAATATVPASENITAKVVYHPVYTLFSPHDGGVEMLVCQKVALSNTLIQAETSQHAVDAFVEFVKH